MGEMEWIKINIFPLVGGIMEIYFVTQAWPIYLLYESEKDIKIFNIDIG